MKSEANAKKKKEKFTSNIFELINYFKEEPWIQLPYAYFSCDWSEKALRNICCKFFRIHLESGEVKCVDSATLKECNTPYCCSVLCDLKDLREIQRLEEEKNEELL